MLLKPKMKILIWLLILLIQVIFISSCTNTESIDLTYSKPQNAGNTIVNLLNYGAVANDDNSVYYIASKGAQVSLNKKDISSGENLVIGNLMCLFLNVVDDYIYYVDAADSTIHKTDLFGRHDEKLSDYKADFLFVLQGKIYALGNESDIKTDNLFSMNNDGSDFNVLSNDNINIMYFDNKEIYYSAFGEEQMLLYKIDMDGCNKEILSQSRNDQSVRGVETGEWFYIYNGKLFYLTVAGGSTIRKFDLSTKEDSLVYNAQYNIQNWYINASDNIVYFKSIGPRIYNCLNLDTGEVNASSMSETTDVGMYIIGNKVFYYENEQPYIMNLDGSGRQPFK